MEYQHKGLPISLSPAPEVHRWSVREGGGEEIGQVQEAWEGCACEAWIIGYEGYRFPNKWAAATALAYGLEVAREEMAMVGY